MAPLLSAVQTLPIVFVNVADPVGAGFVESLAQPGGNATGFMQFEYSLSGKWVELIKQLAPGVTRAAVLRDPTITSGIGQFAVIQSVGPRGGRGQCLSTCGMATPSSGASRPLRGRRMA